MLDLNPALIAAKDAQDRVDACLDSSRSFRLEAGAGAGKTYSLVTALKRIIAERGPALLKAGQKVACITYTQVASAEIAQEIEEHPAILVSTIHAFAWAFLRPFQQDLRRLIAEEDKYRRKIDEQGGVASKTIDYDLGIFSVDDTRVKIGHDDVPLFMAKLLQREKFRRLLIQQYPVIFIDEYQDTDHRFMSALNEFFFGRNEGPVIGLFGDHWQTIFRSDYKLTDYPIECIGKGSNFRSAPAIVSVLNALRPELRQAVRDPNGNVGEARFFHTNAYGGERTNLRHSKGDLPPELARQTRQRLLKRLETAGWDVSKTKVLMLTHNSLAEEQGYPNVAKIFSGRTERYVKKEEPVLKFFAEVLEPVYLAYSLSRYGDMFKILGTAPNINTHVDKLYWRRDMDVLERLRSDGSIGQVLDHLKESRRPALPARVLKQEALAARAATTEDDSALARYRLLREVPYQEVIHLVQFIEGETPFATQHSVKGAEFENVLVVLGGGWNQYNWPRLFELLRSDSPDVVDDASFYRTRNLFYVSISRPMVRLAVLITQRLSDLALGSVAHLFGSEGVEALPFE